MQKAKAQPIASSTASSSSAATNSKAVVKVKVGSESRIVTEEEKLTKTKRGTNDNKRGTKSMSRSECTPSSSTSNTGNKDCSNLSKRAGRRKRAVEKTKVEVNTMCKCNGEGKSTSKSSGNSRNRLKPFHPPSNSPKQKKRRRDLSDTTNENKEERETEERNTNEQGESGKTGYKGINGERLQLKSTGSSTESCVSSNGKKNKLKLDILSTVDLSFKKGSKFLAKLNPPAEDRQVSGCKQKREKCKKIQKSTDFTNVSRRRGQVRRPKRFKDYE